MQIRWRAEIREDAIAGAGELRAEREAEAAKAALLELHEVARKGRLVGADFSVRRSDGEAREAEAESGIRERQEDRVARLRRGIETVRIGQAAAKAEASRGGALLVDVGEHELARPVAGEPEFLDLRGRVRNGQPLPGQDDRR